jgi:2-polyprenyl-3-methyl-5-hydroxy-6-metoxy-1,4-benzoquinol methylase
MSDARESVQGKLCPLCRHTEHQVLYRIDARITAEHMYHFTGSEEEILNLVRIIEKLWGTDEAGMLRCGNCQLIFADPFLAGSGEFYSEVYRKASYYPDWKWDYEITYQDLQQKDHPASGLKDAQLLEVGAGNGAFVKKLASNLFRKENIVCTEYSEFGAKQIRDLGIQCISGPLQSIRTRENKGRFDIICMFQVLEHMENLKAQFEMLDHLSKEGTILYIAVPADVYRAFYDRLGRYMDTPPNHISRWSLSSFHKLGEVFGWKLKEHEVQPMAYPEKLKRLIFDRLEFHGIFSRARWAGRRLPFVRKMGLALSVVGIVLMYAGAVIRLRDKRLGLSQWAKLVKE